VPPEAAAAGQHDALLLYQRIVLPAPEEYAVSKDGMRMFGIVDIESSCAGCRFAIGVRNSQDKSFRLSLTVALRQSD